MALIDEMRRQEIARASAAAQKFGGTPLTANQTSLVSGRFDQQQRDMAAGAEAAKSGIVPIYGFRSADSLKPTPSVPGNSVATAQRTPLLAAAGITAPRNPASPYGVASTPNQATSPRSLIDAAREVAPGVYNHGRGQYSDNPKGMGLIAAAGLGGAQTTPGPAQRMGLVEMARQQNASGTPAWSSADNATMAANLRDGVDLYRGTPQGTQAQPYTPPQDTGGYGLLDKNTRDLRNARLQAELMKPGARMALAGLLREQGSAADRMAQASEAAAGRAFQAGQNEADRALKRDALSTDAASNMARLGIDQQRLGLEASSPERDSARLVADIQRRYMESQDPAERQRLAEQMAALRGGQQNRYTVVGGGQQFDSAANQVLTQPSRVFNNQTGQFVDAPAAGGPMTVTTPQQLAALPSGSIYTGPDGRQYRKN